jgi:hypothetical protein
VPEHPEYRQDHADHNHDDADRPEDGDFGDEADDEEDYAEDNHGGLLTRGGRRPGRSGSRGTNAGWLSFPT